MSPVIATLIVGVWLACGFINHGLYLAYFQRAHIFVAREHRRRDLSDALFGYFSGPVALLATLLVCGVKHGFMLSPLTKEQWVVEATKQYPMNADYFRREAAAE